MGCTLALCITGYGLAFNLKMVMEGAFEFKTSYRFWSSKLKLVCD